MSKLTLSVDDRVVSRAKLYARQSGVSVSEMVEVFLDAIAGRRSRCQRRTDFALCARVSQEDATRGLPKTPGRQISMKRILFDVNVVLDVLLDRKPHAAASAAMWGAVETGAAEGLLAAHAVTTIDYLARKDIGSAKTREILSAILRVFGIAPVDETPSYGRRCNCRAPILRTR